MQLMQTNPDIWTLLSDVETWKTILPVGAAIFTAIRTTSARKLWKKTKDSEEKTKESEAKAIASAEEARLWSAEIERARLDITRYTEDIEDYRSEIESYKYQTELLTNKVFDMEQIIIEKTNLNERLIEINQALTQRNMELIDEVKQLRAELELERNKKKENNPENGT